MKFLNMLALCFLLGACAKDPVVEDPNLTVSLPGGELAANVPVKFNVSSDASLLTFYSGEVGGDYEFKDGRVVPKGVVTLSFSNNVNFGTQANQFSVLASSNFNGNFTIENVKAATWTNITNRFTLATNSTLLATSANLSDLVVDGKPLYIAFRYITEPQTANGTARTWTVRDFVLNSNTSIGLVQLSSQANAGFQLVNEGTIIDPSRSSVTGTTITLRGNNVNTQIRTETWAISKPFDAGEADLGPDKGIPVKGYLEPSITEHVYTYSKPGTYKATFVAANSTVYGTKEVVKSIDVVVK
jgi:hypothetical protein